MDTEVIDRIKLERQRYVDYFEQGVTALCKDKDSFAIELPIQTKDETISAPFNIIRVDFITKAVNNEHSISDLRLDKLLDYPNKKIFYKSLQIRLNPFCWNSCEFQVDKIEIAHLRNWVIKWLKIDEDLIEGELSGAIHSCSEPELLEGKFHFVIDFGTSKESAVIEFIDLLNDTGTTEICIQTIEI